MKKPLFLLQDGGAVPERPSRHVDTILTTITNNYSKADMNQELPRSNKAKIG